MQVEPNTTDAALQIFRKRVEISLAAYSNPTVPLGSRLRYVSFIEAVSDLMRALDFHPIAVMQIQSFSVQIQDLDYGIVSSTLTPNKTHARAVEPTTIWTSRAWLCIAAEYAIQYKSLGYAEIVVSNDDVYEEIAKISKGIAKTIARKNKNYPQAIEGWHRLFREKRIKSRHAQYLFDTRHTLVESLMVTGEPQQEALCLERAAEIAIQLAVIDAHVSADQQGHDSIVQWVRRIRRTKVGG
jgi:hypothetical protein